MKKIVAFLDMLKEINTRPKKKREIILTVYAI